MIPARRQAKGLQDERQAGLKWSIREVEYCQAFPFGIHGGRDVSLAAKAPNPRVLDMLASNSYLPDEAVDDTQGRLSVPTRYRTCAAGAR